MPIEALPQTTIRAIGSSSVISDSSSIVKELLDNALDASALFIAIEISQNTLDVIQVKDNGHGIPSEDHAFVCKRTFTSKIQTVDDLKNIGGNYLGFRGEALASAAEMSSGITVTTRVEAELAGSSIKYGRNGELISTQRAPHPVGTTVRISNFLKYIPVRRQTAQKCAAKTLAKIKKMVQAYAMSQSSKRFSLKVLKAKNESNNWMYAPGQNASLMDATLKVAGTDVASCCAVKSWSSEDGTENAEQQHTGYELVAVLPKPDGEFWKLSNAGQFFSVDGRPLSTARAIGRDITKLYRSYLRAATVGNETSALVADPFLCLHIHCPKGVYDINIEPAKDDILFEDPQLVLSLVESLFRDSYGELPSAEDRHQGSTKKDKPISTNGFELLLARKGTDAAPPHQSSNKDVIPGPVVTPSSSWKLPSSASRPYHSHDKEQAQETSQIAGSESQSKDRESLNPWVLTKMNTPNRLPTSSCPTHDEIRRLSIPKITKESTNPRRSSKHNSQQSLSSSAIPSSNSASRSTSTSPSNARHPASPFQVPTQRSPTTVPDSLKRSRERDRERYGNGAIDTWFEKTNRVAPLQGPDESELEQVEPSLTQLAETRFGSQSRPSSRSETSTQGFGFRTAREIMESPNPFELPRQNYFSSGRHSRSPEVEDSFHELPTPEESPCRMPGLSGFRNNPGLNDALDFERRKKEVIQKRREQMRAGAEPTNSPHHSRYLAAKAALATDSNPALQSRSTSSEENTSESTLSRDDPRAYLMRQKNIQQENGLTNRGPKIQRTQTRRLPFEKIPEGSDAHNLCVTFPATITSVSDSFTQAADTDIYTRTGMDFQAFLSPTPDDVFQTWRDRLSVLVASKYRTKDGSQPPSLEFDLSAIIDHFDSFSEA